MSTGDARYSVGIDIGGTFTDIVIYDDEAGRSWNYKELTTPDDPARGVLTGMRNLFAQAGLAFADVTRVVHATTLFANSLIERKGAPTGMIVTEGFRDILEIGRERKYELYDLFIELPEPLVRRSLRLEVPERLAPDGAVEIELDGDALLERAATLKDKGVSSLALTFLHAYANPVHERRAGELLSEHFPEMFVSLSCEISPQIREYERMSTTVANAYIKPLAETYLERLGAEIGKLGVEAPLLLMLSNGGLTNVLEAKTRPIELLESGPAAGALSGAYFGKRSRVHNVLAFDMGGTTAKLSVIDDGEPVVAHTFEAARKERFIEGSGLPINISTIELIEIGAGGGSIARLDDLGLLKVGPQSAGSVPGPACYQRGGTEPAVTDANLLLGYLNPDYFAGGTIEISKLAAERAINPIAQASDLSVTQIAWGIHNVVNESMAGAARVHIAECGKDPRRYSLLTTGGGGPLHGCEVARKLGIKTVICPPGAGVASAVGLLVAPARIDRVTTIAQPLDAMDWETLEATFVELESNARGVIAATNIDPESARVQRFADIRYIGQGFELVVELPPGPYTTQTRDGILDAFENDYRAIFSRTPPQSTTEVINIRVSLQAQAGNDELNAKVEGQGAHDTALKGRRKVYFGEAGEFVDTPVFDRRKLGADVSLKGPAVVEEPESTLLVPPDALGVVQSNGNIVITLQ